MITFSHKGNFKKTNDFLTDMINRNRYKNLERLARKGVEALSSATPKDTGITAASWSYNIQQTSDSTIINWTNSSTTPSGIPIVILLFYGHTTGTGGYVQGRDFINPAIKPIFDQILKDVWKEVGNS